MGKTKHWYSFSCFHRPQIHIEQLESWTKSSHEAQHTPKSRLELANGKPELARDSQDALIAYLGSGDIERETSGATALLSAASNIHTHGILDTPANKTSTDKSSLSSTAAAHLEAEPCVAQLEWHYTGPMTLQPTLYQTSSSSRLECSINVPVHSHSASDVDGTTTATASGSTDISTPPDSKDVTTAYMDSPSLAAFSTTSSIVRSTSSTRLPRRNSNHAITAAVVVLPIEPTEDMIAAGQHEHSHATLVHRKLSEVFDGHHVHLNKLKQQMGNTSQPPSDLLSLMARRVFSQQGILNRVNSDGAISQGFETTSSFQTPEAVENNVDAMSLPSLPRIRTRVQTANSVVAS